jgi:hypothetical protein
LKSHPSLWYFVIAVWGKTCWYFFYLLFKCDSVTDKVMYRDNTSLFRPIHIFQFYSMLQSCFLFQSYRSS